MAGLSWFELDVDFHQHQKTVALQVELRNPTAEAYVSRIWAYCYHHAIDRFEGPAAVATLEHAANWRGKTGRLVSALLAVRYLECDGETLVAHGVKERLGPHLRAKASAAERQRKHRERIASDNAPVTRDVTGDETRTYALYPDRDRDRDQLPAGRPADELPEFRGRLARALGLPKPVSVGKQPSDVIQFFRQQLDAVGEEALIADCCAAAKKSTTGTPSTLSWFVGWLERLPVPQEVAHADTG
jgi:hypothetical protein